MLPSPQNRRRNGLTLVEILVVIAILGILSTITFVGLKGISGSARKGKAKAELAVIGQALEKFKTTYSDYPWVSNAVDYTATDDVDLGDTSNGAELFRFLMGRQSLGRTAGGAPGIVVLQRNGQDRYGPAFVSVDGLTLARKAPQNPMDAPHLPQPNANVNVDEPDFHNVLVDPWGNPYVYQYRRVGNPNAWGSPGFVLLSAGPDGILQTTINPNGSYSVSSDSDDILLGKDT